VAKEAGAADGEKQGGFLLCTGVKSALSCEEGRSCKKEIMGGGGGGGSSKKVLSWRHVNGMMPS
jgi:hypothetical protein